MAKHILIIGSPGSGKSVFSAALASAAGKRNRQTLLISGDSEFRCCHFMRKYGYRRTGNALCRRDYIAAYRRCNQNPARISEYLCNGLSIHETEKTGRNHSADTAAIYRFGWYG